MISNQFALDISQINKGTVIPVETIEQVVGMESTHVDFWKKKLQLKAFIERSLRAQNVYATIRECNGCLEVLLDEEATAYNFNWFRRHVNAALASHQRLLEVDTRNLSSDAKIEHRRRVEMSSFIVQGINDKVKQISVDYPTALPVPQFRDRVKVI